jgi:hypothetical protein
VAGHKDLAVNDKTFAYMSLEGEPFSLSCKLPQSAGAMLELPFTRPTDYGLGQERLGDGGASARRGAVAGTLQRLDRRELSRAGPKRLVKQLPAA